MSDARGTSPHSNPAAADMLAPLRVALARAPKWERYRALASLLEELVSTDAAADNGRAVDTDQLDQLTKRVTRLREEKAAVEDMLAATKVDLEAKAKQAEVESARAKELQRIVDDQRGRMDANARELERAEADLVLRNSEVHKLEVQNEQLNRQLERAKLGGGGSLARVNELEEEKHKLMQQIKTLEQEKEQIRVEKNEEIRRMGNELATAGAASSTPSGEAVLTQLWERLIRAQPALARGPVQPNVQSGERLFDAFIVLTKFSAEFETFVRPFVTKWTKFNDTVKRPWDVYSRQADLLAVIKETVDAKLGRPVGVLRQRLAGLKTWTGAGLIACDTAIESISEQLEEYMRSPALLGADPNLRAKDFLRQDGAMLFQERIRELLSQKLAQAFGHGA